MGRSALLPTAFSFSPIYTEHVKLQKSGSGSGTGIVLVFTTL